MKCFHFSDGEAGFRPSRLSWVRSYSLASTVSESMRSWFDTGLREIESSEPGSSSPSWRWGRPEGLRAFQFAELKSATQGFSRSNVIGEGGFGRVYKGVVEVPMEDGGVSSETLDVAVKQLNKSGLQGHKEWITEVNFLSVVKHRNLVSLVGYCAEDDERGIQRLLVYELATNRSLEEHLLVQASSTLPWALRLKIAKDAACGLAYLHEEMDFQVIFRDFKSSNILLDKDYNAKLSDFGLARHGPVEGGAHASTTVAGTTGYVAPEYIQTGRLTTKSDVWSFGVVLYELITGRRSVDRNLPRSEQKLLDWVRPYVRDVKELHVIVDPRLKGCYCINSVRKLVALANRCLMKQPKLRPNMSEVVESLDQIIELLDGPRSGPTKIVPSVEDPFDLRVIPKVRGRYRVNVLAIMQMMSLRNRCVGRLATNRC